MLFQERRFQEGAYPIPAAQVNRQKYKFSVVGCESFADEQAIRTLFDKFGGATAQHILQQEDGILQSFYSCSMLLGSRK